MHNMERMRPRLTFQLTLGSFSLELPQFTSGTMNLGQYERDTPNLSLVSETVLSSELFIDQHPSHTNPHNPP